ncbi:MAG: helix-turn-helix domain-containing protein [Chloroflexi bacterium]|nr:helix-turn-helix domain-containing protein [Chloroflexota bacterium]
MEKTIERAALSIEEGFVYIGVGRAHFYRLMEGEIPSFHIGRRRLVRKSDLDLFLERRLAAAGYESKDNV